MVDVTETMYQYARSIQVEGTSQCSWRATRARREQLGHLRPCSDLANHPPVSDPLPPPWMVKSSTFAMAYLKCRQRCRYKFG